MSDWAERKAQRAVHHVSILPDYLKEYAENPRWDEAGRVHDWRNYISDNIIDGWNGFTIEQRYWLIEQANELAEGEGEEWE